MVEAVFHCFLRAKSLRHSRTVSNAVPMATAPEEGFRGLLAGTFGLLFPSPCVATCFGKRCIWEHRGQAFGDGRCLAFVRVGFGADVNGASWVKEAALLPPPPLTAC